MRITTDELFARICRAVPAFTAVFDEHRERNGELLPHVLMGDLGLYVASGFTSETRVAADPPNVHQVRTILSILNDAMVSGDEATENVIGVSFLEYLSLEPYYRDIEPMLGANLRAEIARQKELGRGRIDRSTPRER